MSALSLIDLQHLPAALRQLIRRCTAHRAWFYSCRCWEKVVFQQEKWAIPGFPLA